MGHFMHQEQWKEMASRVSKLAAWQNTEPTAPDHGRSQTAMVTEAFTDQPPAWSALSNV